MSKATIDIGIGEKIKVRFETMALGGRAKGTPIDHPQGAFAVFADSAAPGDLAWVRVDSVVKRFVEAEIIELLERSEMRVQPRCEYFGTCGGCNWQHLDYDFQVEQKAEIVSYVLARNGLAEGVEIHCHPSTAPYLYRSRADMTFQRKGDRLLGGFLKPRTHAMMDIAHCEILALPLSENLAAIKKALGDLVSQIPEDWPFQARIMLDQKSRDIFVQPKLKGSLSEGLLGTYRLDGDHLEHAEGRQLAFTVDGMEILYDPFCFTQINMTTNEQLVAASLEGLDIHPEDRILELYAGIGNFTMPIAKRAGSVLAVESAPASAEFSKINARANSLSNVVHFKKDAGRACRMLQKKGDWFEKVLVDPPRTGMGEEAVNALCALEPKRIVSVSCHPDSLAKDLKCFKFRGYEIESIQGFDMFGQTFHVETVTVLKKI